MLVTSHVLEYQPGINDVGLGNDTFCSKEANPNCIKVAGQFFYAYVLCEDVCVIRLVEEIRLTS